MKISVKRVYDPVDNTDGLRILADRLWPRGVQKDEACIDLWLKELAPSTELRTWYHENKETRYRQFVRKFKKELLEKEVPEHVQNQKNVTLLTSVKEIERSHIPVIVNFLKDMSSGLRT